MINALCIQKEGEYREELLGEEEWPKYVFADENGKILNENALPTIEVPPPILAFHSAIPREEWWRIMMQIMKEREKDVKRA